MSSNGHIIPDLKEKIHLILSNKVNNISSQAVLARVSGIGAPTINRWLKNHYSKVGESDFSKLREAYRDVIPEELWKEPIEIFAQKLNLQWISSQKEVSGVARIYNNHNYESRISDKRALQKTFEIMQGYWEQYRYAISSEDEKCVVYALIEVKNLNEDNTFECTKVEYNLNYQGYFYQGHQNLFFKLQEENPVNGEIFMITNVPTTDKEPKINGILLGLTCDSPSLYQSPAAAKIALRYIGSLDKVKEKYGINEGDISLRELTEKVYSTIMADRRFLTQDILYAIDNHIPQNSTPFALRAGKHNPAFTGVELLAQLKHTLHNTSVCEIERKCLDDYFDLLKNGMSEGEYRFIKRSDYYFRIGVLAKEVVKNIIATYIYEDYDHDSVELNKFSQFYFDMQVKLIKEKNISVCRIFIIKNAQPDDFLLKKMYQEEQAGIEVLFLQEKDWVNSSLRTTYVVDFAMFDEEKVIMLGEKEPFSSVQTASFVTNKTKIKELIELFNANKNRANYLTDEMRQKVNVQHGRLG